MLFLGSALGVTPMLLFLTGAINPNGVEIAAAFCLWLLLLDLFSRPADRIDTRLLVQVGVASVLLATSRPLSAGFLLIIFTVVALLLGTKAKWAALWREVHARLVGALILVVTLLSALYVVANKSLGAFIDIETVNTSRFEVARTVFGATGGFIEQAIGVLAWIGPGQVRLPRLLIDGWVVAVALLVGLALAVGRNV